MRQPEIGISWVKCTNEIHIEQRYGRTLPTRWRSFASLIDDAKNRITGVLDSGRVKPSDFRHWRVLVDGVSRWNLVKEYAKMAAEHNGYLFKVDAEPLRAVPVAAPASPTAASPSVAIPPLREIPPERWQEFAAMIDRRLGELGYEAIPSVTILHKASRKRKAVVRSYDTRANPEQVQRLAAAKIKGYHLLMSKIQTGRVGKVG